ETGEVQTFDDEDAFYRALGYDAIPPELRENLGEVAAARKGELPELVGYGDLLGDLHCHSTWSADGRSSIEAMARTAIGSCYAYLTLTDHSHYLREGRMEAEWEEIEAVNERVAPFRVLRGVEANITAAGEVDVPDDLLAELDWVVASLHTSFSKSPT